jgi:Ankyrin repeats (3 copies)
MVQFLLQVNPYTASIPSKKQKLALHFAAGDGHIQVVRALLRVNPEGASAPSKKGKIPLHFAARWGHMKVAQDLLYVYPAGVSCLDWEGSLPLHDAARDGQTIMAQFLLERHPQGLSTANLRGEIPLFPAVRSGNVALVICLLKAWPMGGKHILQHVNADDNIREWDESIVELCLRGAVGNFNNCTILDGPLKPLVGSLSLNAYKSSPNHKPHLKCPSRSEYILLCSPLQDSMADNSTSPIQDNRPKSPLVEERESKKRSQSQIRSTTKRSKPDSVSETPDFPCCYGTHRLCGCEFYHLHAALSSGASASVLQVVMERFGEQQLRLSDCQGQLPIHIAMANTKTDDAINVVLDQVLRPFPEAATIRDMKARLPLHVGLHAKADFRLVNALLELHPLSKVEICDTRDARYANKAPLWMATGCDCDLSTVYSLLLGDPTVLNDLRL